MIKWKFRKIISISRLSLYDPISDDFFLTSRFEHSEGREAKRLKNKLGSKKRKLTHQWIMEKRKKLEKIWNSKKARIGRPEISDPKNSIK